MFFTGLFFVAGIIWILTFIQRLPRDISRMGNYYQQKNWEEFSIELIIFSLGWGISIVFFITFVGPISWLMIKGLYGFILLLKGMMI